MKTGEKQIFHFHKKENSVLLSELFDTESENSIELTDTAKYSEVLLSFEAESREEIDKLAKTVVSAGGTLFSEVGEVQGWMYGFGFNDLDGHRWNALHMDFNKIPKQ